MRIFTAQLEVETNSFSPIPTGWRCFEQYGIYRASSGNAAPTEGAYSFLTRLRQLAEADGHEVVDGLRAFCMPGGPVVRNVYERLRDEILAELRAAMPVDIVQLMLHGAMIAEGCVDCEGDLLARVRALVGKDIVVSAELDLHCHFTEQMRASADLIIAYKEYPHTDIFERAAELYRLGVRVRLGTIQPTTAVFDCRMVGLWHTPVEPMKSFVEKMRALERAPGVLSVSFGHGDPDGDMPESGAKIWVITDNDTARAAQLAQQLAKDLWVIRDSVTATSIDIDRALDQVESMDGGPIVLADMADNAGGGAPSDSTSILDRLLARQIVGACVGYFWDIGAIEICRDAGVGACMPLRLGGKCGPTSGRPIDLEIKVRAIVENHGQSGLGTRWPLGTSVWIEAADGLDIVLVSLRAPVLGPDGFSDLGINLAEKKLIVVKSMQHFYEGFAPIAKSVLYVGGPGALSTDFERIPYKLRNTNYWPRVADPFNP
jgi:microcystin degradation protein MlrC